LNPRPPPCQGLSRIDENIVEEYLKIKSLSGVSNTHLYETRRFLNHYLKFVDYKIDKEFSINYFSRLLEKYSVSTYRKTVYQILKFLRFLKIDWTNEIKLPAEPEYIPKHISKEEINKTLKYFNKNKLYSRFRAVILLGISSGIRAQELYQLRIKDIDLDNRIVNINHNPNDGQTTKTKKSRISFFNEETKHALEEYFRYFNNGNQLKVLFPQIWLERKFRVTPIRVKHLRKYFSQEWDRRGGATSIKKIIMGHSLKGDVDLMHYNYQSKEDLRKIYDNIMSDLKLLNY
jgi:integrase/recombinase XerD